jgi:HlyD family secretion protein
MTGMTILRKPVIKYGLIAAGMAAAVWLVVTIASNRPISVTVAADAQNVIVRVFGLGTVEARVLSKIGFEVGATLVDLNADHGDHVGKGQVLARLATSEQEARVAKARAALAIAEVNIQRAAANVEKAQAVFAQKRDANRRKQSLASRDVISQQAAEEALRDEAVANADVAVAMTEAVSSNRLLKKSLVPAVSA